MLLEQEWAEWMVVITTSLFCRWSFFEIYKEQTVGRILLFVLNVAIMVYLCFRIRTQKRIKRTRVGVEGGRDAQAG